MSYAQSDVQLRAEAEWRWRQRQKATFLPEFRGAALEAQTITNHEWMLAGPAETGKTFAGMWRLDYLLRTQPQSNYTLVRKVMADIVPTVLQTYKRIVKLSGSGAEPYGGENPQWFDYPNGARLYLAGMDRPEKVLSGERDGFYINQAEELALGDFETITTRATGRGAVTKTPMVMGDANPGPPTHWIINRPSLKVLYSRHEDNPSLYDNSGTLTEQGIRTMAVLDALTGVRKQRLRFGKWVSAEGVVYEEFDRGVHLIEHRTIPNDWRRFRVVDFGYTNPFVCQWWAIDHDSNLYLYREIYKTQTLVEDHARRIKELSYSERIEANVCDHEDAEGRATLEKYLHEATIPAQKEIENGIQAVKSRLGIAGNGRARIFVMKGALVEVDEGLREAHKPINTEQEFDVYMWPKGVDGKAIKEVPVDADNHGLDCLRYAVQYVDGGNRAWRRSRRAA